MGMVEVMVDSIRISLTSHHRVVVLKDQDSDRYLPIWIGACEADAITVGLQGYEIARPLTHDLLWSVIDELGGTVTHILVSDLQDDTFYAHIAINVNGLKTEVDSRPSDAIALAVRAKVPIYVADSVMDRAAIVPGTDATSDEARSEEDDRLEVFRDFVEGLDLSDLGAEDRG